MKLVASIYLACLILFCSCVPLQTPKVPTKLGDWQYGVTVRVLVVCPDGTGGAGSGVAVGPSRILTAYHVTDACEGAKFAVLSYDGQIRPAIFGEGDQAADAATLSTGGPAFEYWAQASVLPVNVDDTLCSVGGDADIKFLKKCGLVFDVVAEGHILYTSIPTVRGNSGGPVFRGRELVGIVVAARTDPTTERVNKSMGVPAWGHLVGVK